jgi:hypothetical protein
VVFPALAAWSSTQLSWAATPLDPASSSGVASPAVTAPSDASRVDIQWDAPPDCPDVSAVRAHAERLLGQPLATPRAQQILARAKVHRNEAGNWELWLSLTANDRVAQETLIAKQCSALADATALKVALAIDPVATARAIEVAALEAVSEPKATSAPLEVGVPQPVAPPAPEAPTSPTSGGVRLTGGAGLGLLPGVARSAALNLWLQRSQWRAELAGQGFFGDDAHDARVPTVGARLQLFSALARGCPVARAGSVEFPLCLGLELGFMSGAGFGLEIAEKSNSWWGSVVLGPALRLPVSGAISLWFEADGVVPFLKPGFNIRNLGTLYTAAPGSARLWVGCEIRLSR